MAAPRIRTAAASSAISPRDTGTLTAAATRRRGRPSPSSRSGRAQRGRARPCRRAGRICRGSGGLSLTRQTLVVIGGAGELDFLELGRVVGLDPAGEPGALHRLGAQVIERLDAQLPG